MDVNDGTFERIVNEAIENLKIQPGWAENWKYLDIFVMVHMAEKRSQWMYWNEQINNMTLKEYALDEAYNNHRKALWKQMRAAVDNKYCIKITVDSHANMKTNFPVVDIGEWCHIIPNSSFDHEQEGYAYNYKSIPEAMKLLTFRVGDTTSDETDATPIWTDWLDFD